MRAAPEEEVTSEQPGKARAREQGEDFTWVYGASFVRIYVTFTWLHCKAGFNDLEYVVLQRLQETHVMIVCEFDSNLHRRKFFNMWKHQTLNKQTQPSALNP